MNGTGESGDSHESGFPNLPSRHRRVRSFVSEQTVAAYWRQQHPRALAEALGMAGLPAAVLDRSGEVLASNRFMTALVPMFVRGLRGRARLADTAADRLLENTLTQQDVCSGMRGTQMFPVPRRGRRCPLIVQLVPLHHSPGDVAPHACMILIITLVRPRPVPSADILQQLFGLSPAEARVASGIAAQRTSARMADDFGVSRETIRSQIKTVLAKTGTRRQLDLAVLLSGLHVFAAAAPMGDVAA